MVAMMHQAAAMDGHGRSDRPFAISIMTSS
jgi:hypothetical protein